MVCDGPDPPDNNPHELQGPPRHDLPLNGQLNEESDDENHDNFGYEPLPQGPEFVHSEPDSDENIEIQLNNDAAQNVNLPSIETLETAITRDIWNAPHNTDSIQMDNERAQQVMSAMANFSLPETQIPEWAQSINEEQWKQTLIERIERIKNNR